MIEVYLDSAECKNFLEPDRWARECCESYCGITVSDIGDLISIGGDEIAVYMFHSSADAAFFTMMWKGK